MTSASVFKPTKSNTRKAVQEPKLMLFDLDYRGHHAGYIQHLVKYWQEREFAGHLDVLVSQQFVHHHPDVVALESKRHKIQFVPITASEQADLVESAELGGSFKGRIQRAFQEWKLIKKYTKELETTHCMLMYLDTVLLRLALQSRWSCPFSSLYFRPIFHYSNFPNYSPEGREQIWQWRDQFCLSRLLRSSALQTLFCLDPFAVEALNQIDRKKRAVYLQDPVQIYEASPAALEQLRQRLGVQPNRKIGLLFGVLDQRKGTHQLLDAIASLPHQLCEQLCILLIGPAQPDEKAFLHRRIEQITQDLPVQIVCQHDFVSDQDIQPYFQLADLILAPYQRHIGMSAILVRAAAAQRPVLSSDFGLMGEVTRRHQLGLSVDSTNPAEIAKGIQRFLQNDASCLCVHEEMTRFAELNKAEEFASKVFYHLMPNPQSAE